MNVASKLYYASNSLTKRRIPLIPKLLYWVNRMICACDIPPHTQIGRDLHLAHNGLGVVINGEARIGNNVKILQQVTIGGRGELGVPSIGDDVIIGAKASIMGGVCVGNGAKIGAHALVLCDVPAGATAIGVPAKIIQNDD